MSSSASKQAAFDDLRHLWEKYGPSPLSGQLQRIVEEGKNDPPENLLSWVDANARVTQSLSAQQFNSQVQRLCVAFDETLRLKKGDRVILCFAPGLDFVVSFYACIHTGVVAVPVYPPDPSRAASDVARFCDIAETARAACCLTNSFYRRIVTLLSTLTGGEQRERWGSLRWHCTPDMIKRTSESARRDPTQMEPSDICFMQFTSGSTSTPKGVMVTHGSLLHNIHYILRIMEIDSSVDDPETSENAQKYGLESFDLFMERRHEISRRVRAHRVRGFSWLPLYHDMGLIGTLIFFIFFNIETFLMSPLDFIRRPQNWLVGMSKYAATVSAGPNFAFELVTRKMSDVVLQSLDLSHVSGIVCGAEPIKAGTLERFLQRFAVVGFKPWMIVPAYGLAESTLMVSGRAHRRACPQAISVDAEKMRKERQVCKKGEWEILLGRPPSAHSDTSESLSLVASGAVFPGMEVLIVETETLRELPEGRVGEVWICSASVAAGYFSMGEKTRDTFACACTLIDGSVSSARFLRTGDSGFILGGQLYIAGRFKDVIIIRGRNYYPQDLEQAVEECEGIRAGCCACFALECDGDEEERVGVAAELRDDVQTDGCNGWLQLFTRLSGSAEDQKERRFNRVAREAASAVLRSSGVQVHKVWLLKARTLPKTSSGKIRRSLTRELLLGGKIDSVLYETNIDNPSGPAPSVPAENSLEGICSVEEIGGERIVRRHPPVGPSAEFRTTRPSNDSSSVPSLPCSRSCTQSDSSSSNSSSSSSCSVSKTRNGAQFSSGDSGNAEYHMGSKREEFVGVVQGSDAAEVSSELSIEGRRRRRRVFQAVSAAVEKVFKMRMQDVREREEPCPESISLDVPLHEHGIDSMRAVEFTEELSASLGLEVDPILLFNYPTLQDVLDFLCDSHETDHQQEDEEGGNGGVTCAHLLGDPTLSSFLSVDDQTMSHDVSVVGAACRLPGGVRNLGDFWELLHARRDAISEVPRSRWEVDDFFDPDPNAEGGMKMYVKVGGFLEDAHLFDNAFFRVSPAEAKAMDPQQRLLLEASYEAFQSSGREKPDLESQNISAFVGCSSNDWHGISGGREISALSAISASSSILANRLSYIFGLRGLSITVDSACSSSLVAIDLAVQKLRQEVSEGGRCQSAGVAALAAGVNLMMNPGVTVAFCKARMLAPDGKCKAFDARADGYVRGEGVCAVVLTRLDAARSKGERVLAVVKASATNHGGRAGSLTAPRAQGQQEVIRDALRSAGLSPACIGFLEAHGTGTALGDPIELSALKAVFGSSRSFDRPILVGSVKTNIGHLEGAAGIAGFLKLLVALQHKEVPPNLHFESLNPKINTKRFHFAIPTETIPFPLCEETGQRLTGGVSSFGFGGTNAHVILQEPPPELAGGILTEEEERQRAEQWQHQPIHWTQHSHRGGSFRVSLELLSMSVEELKKHVSSVAVETASQVLGGSASELPPMDAPLQDLGIDSLGAVELRNSLQTKLGVQLPATVLFDYPTLNGIVGFICQQVRESAMSQGERQSASLSALARLNDGMPVEQPEDRRVAVVGLACRLPGGSTDPARLWQMMMGKTDCMSEVPLSRWNNEAVFDPDPDADGCTYVREAAFIDGIDLFDNGFFSISPIEAKLMDPQQRHVLEVAFEAMSHAGHSRESLRDSSTGVYVGCMGNDWAATDVEGKGSALATTGTAQSILSNRVSFVFGLKGPSMTVDTACSSALVALDMGMQHLRHGGCSSALVAAVNLLLSPRMFVGCCKARMLSPEARCKTFDASANGYARGEGVGAVVVQRLCDAREQKKPVFAVVRGSSVNHDGRSASLTAPNGPSQQEVIRSALRDGGVRASEVCFVEAHGTGTALGDPIEVGALKAVYGEGRGQDVPLVVGALKTNFGHLEGAAGIAGFIKLVLVLQQRCAPPNLHLKTVNPHLDLDGFPVVFPSEPTPIGVGRGVYGVGIGERERLIGAVSSFGFGGTNAHVVVEAGDSLIHVDMEDEKDGEERKTKSAEMCKVHSSDPSHRRKIAFLFTGQGAQFVGMCKELYENENVFHRVIDQCERLLMERALLDFPLTELLFPASRNDIAAAEAKIHQTKYSQPALFAVETALCELWRSKGVEPDVVMGHSLGEYPAAVASGVMSLEDGLRLVAKRARLMEETPGSDGVMAACHASEEEVLEAIEAAKRHGLDAEGVAVAAVNGPRSVVISGPRAGVEAVLSGMGLEGRAKFLSVSHAFHSPLMRSASSRYAPVLSEVIAQNGLKAPCENMHMVSTVTGALASTSELTRAEYWLSQIERPVRFADAVRECVESLECSVIVEVGPQPVLVNMGRQCLASASLNGSSVGWVSSLTPSDGGRSFKDALAEVQRLAQSEGVPQSAEVESAAAAAALGGLDKWKHKSFPFAPLSHPLVGRLRRETGRARIFECTLRRDVRRLLEDYRVRDMASMPGAAFIEMIGAYASANADSVETPNASVDRAPKRALAVVSLNDVEFDQQLVLPQGEQDEAWRTLRVEVSPDNLVTVSSRPGLPGAEETMGENDESYWDDHARCSISNPISLGTPDDAFEISHVDMSAFVSSFCQTKGFEIEEYFDTAAQMGPSCGPRFRGLASLWGHKEGADEGLACLRLPQGLALEELDRSFRVHPAVLDASFQAANATFLLSQKELVKEGASQRGRKPLMVLVGADKVTLGCLYPNESQADVWAHIRMLRRSSENASFDVRMFTQSGRVFTEVFGLHLRPIDLSRRAPPIPRELLWEAKWTKIAKADVATEECSQVVLPPFLFLGGPPEASEELARLHPGSKVVPSGSVPEGEALVELLKSVNWAEVLYLGALTSSPVPPEGNVVDAAVAVLWEGTQLLQALLSPTWPRGVQRPRTVRFVSAAATDAHCGFPVHGGVLGLARSAALELQMVGGRVGTAFVDTSSGIPGAVYDLVRLTGRGNDKAHFENEVLVRDGGIQALRLTPSGLSVRGPLELHVSECAEVSGGATECEGPGMSVRLRAQAVSEVRAANLGSDLLEVRVRAVCLSSRDLKILSIGTSERDGRTGLIRSFAGTVTRVGTAVTGVGVGDDVFGLASDCLKTLTVTSRCLVARKPRYLTFEEAAALPSAAAATVEPLLQPFVCGMGASVTAVESGCEVEASAVSVLLECVALLVEKGDQERGNTALSLQKALRVRAFDVSSTDEAGGTDGASAAFRYLQSSSAKRERNESGGDTPWEGACESERAVMSFPSCIEAPRGCLQSGEGCQRSEAESGSEGEVGCTYIVTGGLGGLGLLVAKWLVGEGAKRIVLVSRRSAPDAETARGDLMKRLHRASMGAESGEGVEVEVRSCDVSLAENCERLLQSVCRRGTGEFDREDGEQGVNGGFRGRLGIVHCAGVLADAQLRNQTEGSVRQVFASKVMGGWNLHTALHRLGLEERLETFVLFSSVASLFGNFGQANYAAANAALDSLAAFRVQHGLRAVSIQWGPWEEQGMAAGAAVREKYRLAGYVGISNELGLRVLGEAMRASLCGRSPRPAVIGCQQIRWGPFLQRYEVVPPFFCEVLKGVERGARDPIVPSELQTALSEMSSDELRKHVSSVAVETASQVLGGSASELPPMDAPLQDLGIDSLGAVEFRSAFQKKLGVRLPISAMFEYPTLDGLIGCVCDLISASGGVGVSEGVKREGPRNGERGPSSLGLSLEESRRRGKASGVLHPIDDIETLCSEVSFEASKALPPKPIAEVRNVLLTGVTGLVGRFQLKSLLEMSEIPELRVHCLVRASDREAALDRIESAMLEANIWKPTYASQIVPLPGDLSEKKLGLSEDQFRSLCREIDIVYHTGADVSLVGDYARLRKPNVLPTQTVIDLCTTHRLKPLHFVSTLAIWPAFFAFFSKEFAGRIVPEDGSAPDPEEMQRHFPPQMVGYPWSKMGAEMILNRARDLGLPVAVYRLPSVYVAWESGYTNTNSGDFASVMTIAAMQEGCFPRSVNSAPFTPVDTIAQMIVEVSLLENRKHWMYHLINTRTISQFEQEHWAAGVGLSLKGVSFEEFEKTIQARGAESPLLKFLPLMHHWRPYWYEVDRETEARRDPFPVCTENIFEDLPHMSWPSGEDVLMRSFVFCCERGLYKPDSRAVRLDPQSILQSAARCLQERAVESPSMPQWAGSRSVKDSVEEALAVLCESTSRLSRPADSEKTGESPTETEQTASTSSSLSPRAPVSCGMSLNFQGRFALLSRCRQMAGNLMWMAEAERRHPEIRNVKVAPPLVILSSSRVAGQLLLRLLSEDPRNCAPAFCEMAAPYGPDGSFLQTLERPNELRSLSSEPTWSFGHRDSESLRDPRVRFAREQLAFIHGGLPSSDAAQPEWDRLGLFGPSLADEDFWILEHSLRSFSFPFAFAVSEYREWLCRGGCAEMREAYRIHKRFLQHLQWQRERRWRVNQTVKGTDASATFHGAQLIENRSPSSYTPSSRSLFQRDPKSVSPRGKGGGLDLSASPQAWVLHSSLHASALGTLLAEYPDAQIVCVHTGRNVEQEIGQWAETAARIRQRYFEVPGTSPSVAGPETLESLRLTREALQSLKKKCREQEGSEIENLLQSRLLHVSFDDLIRNPVAGAERLYGQCGFEMSREARRRMWEFVNEHRSLRNAFSFGEEETVCAGVGYRVRSVAITLHHPWQQLASFKPFLRFLVLLIVVFLLIVSIRPVNRLIWL
uniref:Uncharacterized protein n=1 Tax=Chromera velia CCMP2878 TaxID=1169474 RepID=A0A0G4HR60_9ALVE|eukprot:Cvel_8037.t1-p1 / transcript=Cvel_8037.t1 / gene=Cvel_8037 / organism=Chromera_velia_CCMP2878 / gene_product=Phenolphthiocerol synthesis polyketide synthase, putative / transcript_product=Phenolphthiocerol synthesis polyketide synthase, putative / location=Cvel_scaffold434:65235-82197(+) / protein_length=4666 / sequence_SO=supercontig / SO=protein_coding / is_pseudo=false